MPTSSQPRLRRFHWRLAIAALLAVVATVPVLAADDAAVSPPLSITVVVDDTYPPFSFRGETGDLQGIVVDTWKLWSRKTGMAVTVIGMNWADAQLRMKSGDADVIDTMQKTPEREQLFKFSAPYAKVDTSIFFHKDIGGITGASSLEGFSVGVKEGSACVEKLRNSGVTNLRTYPDVEAVIAAAGRHEVKVFCADKQSALYFLYKMNLEGAFNYTAPLSSGEFHWAVHKGRDDLFRTITQGYAAISADERQEIEKRWQGYSLRSVQNEIYLKYVGSFLATVTMIGVLLTAWNWSLRSQVAAKTHLLTTALDDLAASQRHFEQLVKVTPVGVFEAETHGNVTFVNDRWNEISGLSRDTALAGGWEAAIHPEDRADIVTAWRAAIRDIAHFEREFRFLHSDGRVVWVLCRVVPQRGSAKGEARFIGSVTDITDRKAHEEERHQQGLRDAQASKLEALGQLAGGIAHDFNNLLGAILGFAHFLVQDLKFGTPPHQYAERIIVAGQRGRALVQQIATFSRRGVVEPVPIHLAEFAAETLDLLKATLPSTTRLEVRNFAGDAVVKADKGQLSQVLINLCVNANDALGGEPGEVTLALRPFDRDRSELNRLAPRDGKPPPPAFDTWRSTDGASWLVTGGLPAGEGVSLCVSDSGPGIPEDVLGHIFEPFFTTKGIGQGTGLGLAVVSGIVIDHGGAIIVRTRPAEGTVVEIVLPLMPRQTRGEPITLDQQTPHADLRSRILLVDDDQHFCEMVEIGLRRLGCEVVATNNPAEALRRIRNDPDRWDMVVTDQTMPGMKGVELIRSIKALRPNIRGIVCTGLGDGLDEAAAVRAGADGFMLKPLNMDDFAVLIGRLLGKDSRRGD